jgi:hypothetical protein
MAAGETVSVDECKGIAFSVMAFVYLEAEPPEAPSLFFEAIMTYFKILLQHSLEMTVDRAKKRISCC